MAGGSAHSPFQGESLRLIERVPIREMMPGHRLLCLYPFAIFLSLDCALATEIEALTETVRSSSASFQSIRSVQSGARAISASQRPARSRAAQQYRWKTNIVTTVFWIGERPSGHNLVPNRTSCWDKEWARNYGGFDDPNPANRTNYRPSKFTPRQNPFYCALPYNDKARVGHRPEAPQVVPWFKKAYLGPAVSTCKDRWVAIRKNNRTVYAQWEDAGPFRTDHWQYVFGNERPKPSLNGGAGLDISPAVRDYLGLKETDVTDWRFVEFSEVPRGPWSSFGENNKFVINSRRKSVKLARESP
jgi:hypothetical protein